MEGKIIDDPKQVAKIFSHQFNNNGNASSNNSETVQSFLRDNTERVETGMRLHNVTPIEVEKVVSNMVNKKSCGYDEVPIGIIKENIDILAEPLSLFFNECFEENIFPEQLKIAKILPIFKKGSKTDPKKYWPISLLPTLSKIFEKLLKNRLVQHLIQNNVLSSRQFGYQKGIGTTDAIDSLVDDVVKNLNDRKKVVGLFLDLSAAFDMVDHSILLEKLEYYGVRGQPLALFQSYLQNRTQFVEIKYVENGVERVAKSDAVKISRGVPQGSILGPIFFITFTNDLINFITNKVPDMKLVVFAKRNFTFR